MVFEQDAQRELSSSHSVARYCSKRRLGDDGLPLEEAFRLRVDEVYVSTNWLECFHNSDRPFQIDCVRQSLIAKGFSVRPSARFAVLNVGTATAVCKNSLNLDIKFVLLDELDDPSHTGIYGLDLADDETQGLAAQVLAQSVLPAEVYPAG